MERGVSMAESSELLGGGGAPTRRRATTFLARGEPQIWLMGLLLVVALTLIVVLAARIAWSGSRTFWPRPIERVSLRDGSVFLGMAMESGVSPSGERRTLYRVGNRDGGVEPFRWVEEMAVASRETPAEATLVERREWGIWIGIVERLIRVEGPGTPVQVLATGAASAAEVRRRLPEEASRTARIESLSKHDLGAINAGIEKERLRVKRAELELARAGDPRSKRVGLATWLGLVALTLASAGALFWLGRSRLSGAHPPAWTRPARVAAWCVLGLGVIAVWVESPISGPRMTPERLEAVRRESALATAALGERYDAKLAEIEALRRESAATRVVIRDAGTGRIAPTRQSSPDDPLMLAQIVRIVQPNTLSWWGKAGIYLDRWGEFLFGQPREANTEGGIFPVIVGTVVLTVLLCVIVVPLGVVAALYLREYAKQGTLVSLVRIAVNNLAGVPSIVYGVFGLGFFCTMVGGYVDGGPNPALVSTRGTWWASGIAVVLVLTLGSACAVLASPDIHSTRRRGWAKVAMAASWVGAILLAGWMLVSNPYFSGFHTERLPSPTFGGRGIGWAALTLALLTLPVVIVASEEAIAAVPRSAREGSYGCGASKWQTIRRIVLPPAAPGIMTGAILAMSRGAGEVAPLMLVGAMKNAPQLPFDSVPPYVHLERSFMHLGFHIYDLGFQSPDSEAARPLVWTTTLVLVALVLLLNLAAVVLRARLRARSGGSPV